MSLFRKSDPDILVDSLIKNVNELIFKQKSMERQVCEMQQAQRGLRPDMDYRAGIASRLAAVGCDVNELGKAISCFEREMISMNRSVSTLEGRVQTLRDTQIEFDRRLKVIETTRHSITINIKKEVGEVILEKSL